MRQDARRPDELVNTSAAAELLGVTTSAVSNWRKRPVYPPFPLPWLVIPAPRSAHPIALFVRSEVLTWGATRGLPRR